MHGIREATPADAQKVASLGAQFYDAAGLIRFLGPYSKNAVESLVNRTIANNDLTTLVVDLDGQIIGMAAAVVYPSIFSDGVLAGQELFWWIEPEHRKGGIGAELMAALELWAMGRGATVFTMLSMHGLGHEAVDRLYQRAGYSPLEHTYMKVL